MDEKKQMLAEFAFSHVIHKIMPFEAAEDAEITVKMGIPESSPEEYIDGGKIHLDGDSHLPRKEYPRLFVVNRFTGHSKEFTGGTIDIDLREHLLN